MDDIEAIKQLKARYFRLMDTKDWAAYRQLFVPGLHVDVSCDGAGTYESLDHFMAMLEKALAGVTSVHHGHMPEITLTSSTTASGIWAMEDMLTFPKGGPIAYLHGYGHYHETYVKKGDTWRIATIRLSRLHKVYS